MTKFNVVKAWSRQTVSAAALTLALTLLVAGGVADQGWEFSVAALAVAGLAVGGLHLIFPHGPLFALGVANGLAVYTCLYVVLGRAAFPLAAEWARPLGFLLPVMGFVAACWWRREHLLRLANGSTPPDLAHLPRFARWLMFVAMVGVISMGLPVNRLTALPQSLVLLLAMAAIAGISARAVSDVVQLLMDIAGILHDVGRRLAHLAVPMACYVSVFALLAVVFGCLYRIADGISRAPLFASTGQPLILGFSDALHFSVATLSTVGYGDIHPADDGIRLLAAIQMVLGQLLLLFGFAEIMRSSRGGGTGKAVRPHPQQATEPQAAPSRREVAGD